MGWEKLGLGWKSDGQKSCCHSMWHFSGHCQAIYAMFACRARIAALRFAVRFDVRAAATATPVAKNCPKCKC